MAEFMYGRREIFTDAATINRSNVVKVLKDAMATHEVNSREISYLYDYYRGKQDIKDKVKDVRPEINYKICQNHANEFVSFFLGYVFGDPIQYIRRGKDDYIADDLEKLNNYMLVNDKPSLDKDLAEWMFICGVGYRILLPSPGADVPFEVFNLDPRYSFVVKRNDLKQQVLMGVKYIDKIEKSGVTQRVYSVYTKDRYFEIENDKVIKDQPHFMGSVNIFQYPANKAMLGVFEIVLPLLNAINSVQSNRLDDVVQFVNSFLTVVGAELTDEIMEFLAKWKALSLPENAKAQYLASQMQQSDVKTLVDGLYQSALTIVGVPNRNGGSSTSDTGQAVYLRDGWSGAETRAKTVEESFKKSERSMLKVLLHILGIKAKFKLKLYDLDIKFPRRYTDNILTKVQAMREMLAMGIAPNIVFATATIWNDPEDVYAQSKPYLDQIWGPDKDEVDDNDPDVPTDGQDDKPTA